MGFAARGIGMLIGRETASFGLQRLYLFLSLCCLVLTQNQHWDMRMGQYLLGFAAQKKAFEASATV